MIKVFPCQHRPTWTCRLIVVAAVQGGHAGLIAVAGPVGAVGPPSFAGARRVPAGATPPRLPTARLTGTDQEQRHSETKQRHGAAPPEGHREERSQPGALKGLRMKSCHRWCVGSGGEALVGGSEVIRVSTLQLLKEQFSSVGQVKSWTQQQTAGLQNGI